jgi:thiamine biosynthesis lipoprotein
MMTGLIEISRTFRAMNTRVTAAVCVSRGHTAEAKAALEKVEATFRAAESRFSRFLPESELSTLNNAAGRPFRASRELFDLVAAALRYAGRTGGRFDLAILPDLVAAGYDRSFERLSNKPRPEAAAPRRVWSQIALDRANRTITLPEGGALDLGGIGKGWTDDRTAEVLRRFPGFIIDAGGDIVTGGTQADGSPWEIGIADPFDESRDLAALAVSGGAVCTSSTRKRRWESGSGTAHHIIDPATGQPAAAGVVSATVRAESAAEAEVLAKVAVIAGAEEAFSLIAKWPATGGFLVLEDGTTRYSDGFPFA